MDTSKINKQLKNITVQDNLNIFNTFLKGMYIYSYSFTLRNASVDTKGEQNQRECGSLHYQDEQEYYVQGDQIKGLFTDFRRLFLLIFRRDVEK